MTWSFLILLVVVAANENLFVSSQDIQSIIAYVGDTVVVPCHQISPEQRVQLIRDYSEVKEINDKISFDSKQGFLLKNVSALDAGVYTCIIANSSSTSLSPKNNEGTNYVVTIFTTPVIQNLVIESDNSHVSEGSELSLTCTVEIGIDMPYYFNWTIPRETAVQKEKLLLPQNKLKAAVRSVSSVLNIENVTSDDEGEYFCQVNTFGGTANTHAYVKIYDP